MDHWWTVIFLNNENAEYWSHHKITWLCYEIGKQEVYTCVQCDGGGVLYSVAQSCLTLCDPVDCSPPGSSAHGIFQARTLEWGAISSFKGSSQPRNQTYICISCIGRQILYHQRHLVVLKWKRKWKSLSCVRLFGTPWMIQTLEFSRPEYWSG